jgi:putative ATP-dependent endonuclease of OLD family
MVLVQNGRAFSLAEGQTRLNHSDYRFLARFLDVTKANLFFARGVMIVEGDAENILLPTLAALLDRDFSRFGVSIVNVRGVGLRRYARIFQRTDDDRCRGQLDIPVACVTDMDVMPDCAPSIIGKTKEDEPWPTRRRWRTKSDFREKHSLTEHLREKHANASGQSVKTFVADEWTLEYDLAVGPKGASGNFLGGLAEEVYVAACLAEQDDAISAKTQTVARVAKRAISDFSRLQSRTAETENCTAEEVLATKVYARFAKHNVSKAVAAQYLAECLQRKWRKEKREPADLRKRLPKYLVEAIDYVTRWEEADE